MFRVDGVDDLGGLGLLYFQPPQPSSHYFWQFLFLYVFCRAMRFEFRPSNLEISGVPNPRISVKFIVTLIFSTKFLSKSTSLHCICESVVYLILSSCEL